MKEASNHHKVAFKAATTLLAEENEKANGMSANQVIDHIQKEYGVAIAWTTLSRKEKLGRCQRRMATQEGSRSGFFEPFALPLPPSF